MIRHFAVAVCVLAAVTSAAFAEDPTTRPDEKTYVIKFDRPSKVGQKFRMEGTSRKVKSTVTNATVPVVIDEHEDEFEEERTDTSVELSGILEILKVDEKSQTLALSLTVSEAELTDSVLETTTTVVAKGDVIRVATKDGEKVLSLKSGGELDGQVAGQIKELLLLQGTSDMTDAEDVDFEKLMGIDGPKKVGDSWKLNSKLLAENMSKASSVEVKVLSSRGELADVRDVAGVECMDIQMKIELRPKSELPSGLTMDRSKVNVEMSLLLPVDPTLPVMDVRLSTKSDFRISGIIMPFGAEFNSTAIASSNVEVRYRPVKD